MKEKLIVKQSDNKGFLNKIISQKLDKKLIQCEFEDEYYYVLVDDNVIFGISRLVQVPTFDKVYENSGKRIIKNDNMFFSDIWVDDSLEEISKYEVMLLESNLYYK
jgi:hypothetical protein